MSRVPEGPVRGSALEEYIAGIDARGVPTVRALDAAIAVASPDFDVAIKYRILMYALRRDWGTWVCDRRGSERHRAAFRQPAIRSSS